MIPGIPSSTPEDALTMASGSQCIQNSSFVSLRSHYSSNSLHFLRGVLLFVLQKWMRWYLELNSKISNKYAFPAADRSALSISKAYGINRSWINFGEKNRKSLLLSSIHQFQFNYTAPFTFHAPRLNQCTSNPPSKLIKLPKLTQKMVSYKNENV